VGKPEGKRPLGRPRRKDNNKIDLREIGWGVMDWIDWPRIGPVEGSYKHGNELSGSKKRWNFLEKLSN
jgi:hypothetical protein